MFADAFLSGSWVVGCIMRLPLLPEKQRVQSPSTFRGFPFIAPGPDSCVIIDSTKAFEIHLRIQT